MSHVTHHDDCGCLTARYEARIATLEAELAAANELADGYRLAVDDSDHRGMGWMARANALRDALEELRGVCDGQVAGEPLCADKYPTYRCGTCQDNAVIDAAILATPAASLAAHSQEMWDKGWEEGRRFARTNLAAHDAEVLERGCAAMREVRIEHPPALEDDDQGPFLHLSDIENLTRAIKVRALAAQAATHSELEVKP